MNINCPHCGAKLESNTQALVTCGFCASSFMLESHVHSDNKHSLIQLNKLFYIKTEPFTALKLTQHPHDDGVRLDYLVKNSQNDEFYLMIEDENIALLKLKQTTQEIIDEKLKWSTLLPNSQVELLNKHWLVTQKRALKGEHKQTYLSNQSAELLVLSFDKSHIYCQQGYWLDAFEINREN